MQFNIYTTISHLFQHAPGFKQRMENAKLQPADIQTEADLSKLPVLRKDDLLALQQENPPFAGMLSIPVGQLRRIYQSPGPINDPEPNVDDYWRWEEALRASQIEAGDVALVALNYHMTPAANMAEEAMRKIGVAVIPGGIGNQEQQIQIMLSVGANVYFGLPSYLKTLLDKAKEANTPLKLERAFVFAEPLPPTLRQELESHGLSVFQGYGTAECGNLGYEIEGYEGWRIPDSAIIQICDINTGQPLPAGEIGEVVATIPDEYYALIRFGTGDLSAVIPESLTDDGGPRLKGWLGRIGAATKVRGMFLHPTQLKNTLAQIPDIFAYQAVISRENHKDILRFDVVTNPKVDQNEVASILIAKVKENLKFSVNGINFVPQIADEDVAIRDERTWE